MVRFGNSKRFYLICDRDMRGYNKFIAIVNIFIFIFIYIHILVKIR